MGIRGLCSWIHWASPNTIQEPNWQIWRNKTIGVDILGLLYNAKAKKLCPFLYIGKLVARSKQFGIRILPIFDGRPPSEKSETLRQRSKVREDSEVRLATLTQDYEYTTMSETQRSILVQRIQQLEKRGAYFTSEERELAKQVLYACGILSLNASGEADNVLAYFAKRGDMDAVISNDFDLLARGVEVLLVPEMYALPGDTSGWKQYTLSHILETVRFPYEQFLEMCVLMGTDYTHIHLPFKSAFWNIKYNGFDNAIRKLQVLDTTQLKKAMDLLRGEEDTRDSLMGEKQWNKWINYQPLPEEDTLEILRQTVFQALRSDEYMFLKSDNSQWRMSLEVCRRTHDHPECSDGEDKQNKEQDCRQKYVREDAIDDMTYNGIQNGLKTRLIFGST
jgi:hypothetical protein